MLIKFYGFYLVFVSKIQVGIGFEGVFFQQSLFLWFFFADRCVNNFFFEPEVYFFDNLRIFYVKQMFFVDEN